MRLAVMQGRLLPPSNGYFQCFPRERWREEFALAAEASLDAIEWIYDTVSESDNPISTDSGLVEMKSLGEANGIEVVSLCADYFMERPLIRCSDVDSTERVDRLWWLLGRCKLAGIRRVVLPFVDNSKIEGHADEAEVSELLRRALGRAEEVEVELHLETSLGPQQFSSLLAKLPHRLLKVNYDAGNSASLGFDVEAEIAAYGGRIGSVHIKDRIRGGGTVPLGTGDADIPRLLSLLSQTRYTGDFVLQIARDEPGMEVAWIRQSRESVSRQLQEAGFAGGKIG
jgi:L-ribulose-5-phosphate 3-epimerase